MKRILVNIFFVVFWVLMALVLAVGGTLVCAVKILRPEKLTPIVCNYANKALDADVSAARVELSFKPAFPLLRLDIDSLCVISHALAAGDNLPPYADTLFTLDSFHGGIDLLPLLTRGEIAVGDVELVRPGLNIVLDKTGKGNFDIYRSAPDTTDTASAAIPPFSIRRFAFVEPREIRYFDAADSTEATVVLLSHALVDGSDVPRYGLKIDGKLAGPTARSINLDNIGFGLDGKVRWEPSKPRVLALEDFTVYGAFIRGHLATELSYDSVLTIGSAHMSIEPFAVAEALEVLPADLRSKYRLTPRHFSTDATLALRASLTRPFTPGADSIPYALLEVSVPRSSMRYGRADIRRLELDAALELRGNNLDSARAVLRKFCVAGPATSLEFSGEAARLVSDIDFRAALKGDIDLRRLPPPLLRYVPGYVSGHLDFKLDAAGDMSMFATERFHKLDVRGHLDGDNLYFLSADTAKMASIDGLCVHFGSKHRYRNSEEASPSLAAKIEVDTAAVLIDGVNITLGTLELQAAVENNGMKPDSTRVVPVGGGLKIGRLNIESVTDSAGARLRKVDGVVKLHRFKGNKHLPQLSADIEVGVVAAGTPSSRFMLRQAAIHATTFKNPDKVRRRQEFKRLADSIGRSHPDLPPDSVYKLAIEKRRHVPGRKYPKRVRTEFTQEDYEVIDWGVSKGLRRYLLDWELSGTLTTRNAGLYTPYFPLRNRISMLDLAFSTDSVVLRGVRYRLGRSDLALKGIISNIKRGITTTKATNPLKINIDIESDTIDVNQIAAATFAGSAYAERLRKGQHVVALSGDEDDIERQIEAMVSEHPDTVGPLLVPTNIDGRLCLHAANVLYADLLFKQMHGDILIYKGAVNLHDLDAESEVGSMSLSALYAAPKATDMKCGFSLQLQRFKIERFLRLVPAVDSIMPLMRDFSGIINAEIAATADVDSTMNIELPTLDAAVRLTGDSLALINPETYRTLGKWLRFRDRADNKIKHMNVEMIVKNDMLQVFPFCFDIDRYRLGVLGHNDLSLNFDYHISVLKSPLPFKFGITIKGNPDKYKVRFGGAKFKENMAMESVSIVDTARVSLVHQIENVFRRGVDNSRFAKLNLNAPESLRQFDAEARELSGADSLALIREGILPPVAAPADTVPVNQKKNAKRRKKD